MNQRARMIMLTILARTNALLIASAAGRVRAVIRVHVAQDPAARANSARVAEDRAGGGRRGGVLTNNAGRKVVGRIAGRSIANGAKLPRLCRKCRCVLSRTRRRWKA